MPVLVVSRGRSPADLTAQERSDHISEWIRLVEEKQERERKHREQHKRDHTIEKSVPGEVSRQVGAKPEGGRPEGGTRAASRELGISETQARRAKLISSISEDAKKAGG